MPASALARIHERKPPHWTAALVEQLVREAFRQFPGRGIRVRANGALEPTHQAFEYVGATNILSVAALCVPDRTDREILLYWCRRAETHDGMSHIQAAHYYGFKTRKGLEGAKKRAAKRFADELNARGLQPLDVVRRCSNDTALDLGCKVA